MTAREAFLSLRDRLLFQDLGPDAAAAAFEWPSQPEFNWAREYFDSIDDADTKACLRLVDDLGGDRLITYGDLARRSNRVANYFHGRFSGLLDQQVAVAVGGSAIGWHDYSQNDQFPAVSPAVPMTAADSLMLLYFTSGTTAKPKLVAHTQVSYPIGHLSTAYWIGLRRGDVHLNLSSAGWAKHAWSCFFAPFNAEAVVLAWGLTIRDGFGQTETTAQIGNPPGQKLKPGSMGRPLPGYKVSLVGADGTVGDEGEVCLDLNPRPIGLMAGYLGDVAKTDEVMRDGYYHTGDVASRDPEGYLTYVGRTDDVFKSSDYRISPFELESVLIEHPAVAEAAVVPSPDPMRLSVPKAYVVLVAGASPDAGTARSILDYVRTRVSPFKRIRRIEFSDLPKTISGKIRRVELRQAEEARAASGRRHQEFWEEDLSLDKKSADS